MRYIHVRLTRNRRDAAMAGRFDREWCTRLVGRQFGEHAVAGTPDSSVVRSGPSLCDLQRNVVLAEGQSMRVRHDAEQVAATFGRNEHVAVRWRLNHQHVEAQRLQDRCLKVRELGWEDGLAVRACHDAAAARQCRGEIHLVAKQPHSLQRGDRFCAMRTLHRRFQPIDRIVPFRLTHPASFRSKQTLPLHVVSGSGKIVPIR